MRLGYPTIALDLRGHGESPLGDPSEFSSRALAADVLIAIKDHNIRTPVVLVGHSMGGKIAMQAAAMDAAEAGGAGAKQRLLASVVIEDMDVTIREGSAPLSPPKTTEAALQSFVQDDGRRFESWAAARKALLPWYGSEER